MSAHTIQLLPGDIAACYGRDLLSRTITWCTSSLLAPCGLRWGPSHVAIMAEQTGEPLWIESTTQSSRPCRIHGRIIAGVQAHTPADRINDYVLSGGRIDIYRLVEIESLSRTESQLLSRILFDHFLRTPIPYDIRGALLSGTRVFQLTRMLPRADLQQLFCSELVAAVLMRLGRLPRENPTRFNPARLIRTLVRHGTVRVQYSWSRER
ncbi:MAG: hypothetical protein ACK5Q5_24505 [Planctomycetaceae bacterium]